MFFKLGKKASSFVDTNSGKKLSLIAPGAVDEEGNELPIPVIEFDGREMRSTLIKQAIRGGHIVKCDAKGKGAEDDIEDEDEENEDKLVSQSDFDKMKVGEMQAYLASNFELDDEDVEEIDGMSKKADLSARYAELKAAADEDEDDDA